MASNKEASEVQRSRKEQYPGELGNGESNRQNG